jgi:hypothetical protein
MQGAIQATSNHPKSSGFLDRFIAFFRRLSKGSSNPGAQTQPGHTSNSLPAKIAHHTSQGSQQSSSRKSSADESCRPIVVSTTSDRQLVRINTNPRASEIYFPPIHSPESAPSPSSALASASPTSTFSSLSPSSTLFSCTPDTPSGSRPSAIREESMQSLDMSHQVTLTSPSPIFEGTYSDIYKGSYQRQEARSFLFCGSLILNHGQVAVKSIRVVKDAEAMRLVCLNGSLSLGSLVWFLRKFEI